MIEVTISRSTSSDRRFSKMRQNSIMKQSLILLIACMALLTASALAGDVTIGFIYVGPKDDYGYNQAHALGPPPSRNCQASKS